MRHHGDATSTDVPSPSHPPRRNTRHSPSSPFAIVDARVGGKETAAARGALALRILAHDICGEGRTMMMMMTVGAFEKSPVNNQPPRRGRGRQLRCWARGSRESAGCRGRNYIREEPKRQSVAAGGVSCRAGGGGGRPGCQGRERVVIVVVAIVVVVVVVLSLVWILARRQ